MAVLHLKVLGGFEARLSSGETVEIPIRKGQALLAYLALNPGKVMARSKLAGLLWGDYGDTQAQASLRQTLAVLRKALGPMQDQVLRADRQSIGLDRECIEVDAVSFQDLVASGTPPDLEMAVSLYRGDLLDGFDVSDPGFEAWLENERRHFRELMARALNALMEHKRAFGAKQDAITLGQQLLALDPLQESVHRSLMVLYAELGQRQAALQQFQRCRELLESELGVEPETETEALYQTLRSNHTALDEEADVPDTTIVRQWESPASLNCMALPLPDKPSIVVLPFDNLSGDPEQDYFADGITDDLITELSRLDDLSVIARSSTFAYKGQAVKIGQVAEDLGVHYVLEGSVRQTDDRIRINAQLVDAMTGSHIWAERYDEPLTNIFSVQDKFTRRAALALAGRLTHERQIRRAGEETSSPVAYDAFLHAKKQSRHLTRENFAIQIRNLTKAIGLDPNYARAHAMLGGVYCEIVNEGWETSFGMGHDEAFNKAKHHLKLAMRDPSPEAHYWTSMSFSIEGRYEEAIIEARKIIALNSNDALGYKALGRALNKAGRSAEGIEALKLAIRLDPRGDDQGWVSYRLGEAFYLTGRDTEAVEAYARSAERNQNETSYEYLAASFAQLGCLAEAREALEKFNVIWAEAGQDPLTVAAAAARWPFKLLSDHERVQDGLRKAGMPEGISTILEVDANQIPSPSEIEGAITIDAAMAKPLFDRGIPFIDVRDSDNWNAGHIPGAMHLNFYEDFTETELAEIAAKDQELVIIAHGTAVNSRSARASARAVFWGFTKVHYFRDGFSGWKSVGYPIETLSN